MTVQQDFISLTQKYFKRASHVLRGCRGGGKVYSKINSELKQTIVPVKNNTLTDQHYQVMSVL